jgi:repressor of nif and glnA expression
LVNCTKCNSKLSKEANYCSNCGKSTGESIVEEFEVKSEELVQKTKEIIEEGNITKIIVENEEGKTLLEIPATAGIVGVILAPWLAALGAIAAIATKCKIKVEKRV